MTLPHESCHPLLLVPSVLVLVSPRELVSEPRRSLCRLHLGQLQARWGTRLDRKKEVWIPPLAQRHSP